ncbi:short chain dehydrogenase [Marinobacterium sp. xm-d-420]|uniref:NAD-dependent epimerase/dehydratase family protein n=1 Tax=Marinobacterium sp. xm-d-420 TaxID=2497737 RepID=UPI001569837B|nr:short chain dehydrogenase [Marinobacterium sp. xm-d-420]
MHLIIGGSGFIGTRLSKRLERANTPFQIVDKAKSNTYPELTQICDIRERERLLGIDTNADVIINLAAEHRDDVRPKSLYDEVNVMGSQHVCDLAEAKGINKIIFTSSVAVYGFAERGTDENGKINPFNDYGRTKYEAELIYKKWQAKDPANRTLVIVRPTVVFGEQNRGNVYNLLKQIASGKFVMIGNGQNRKSMAYVENVAAFLEFSNSMTSGVHTYNYIDKPDFDMNSLVKRVKKALGKEEKVGARIPYWIGMLAGYAFDLLAKLSGKNLPISSIRIQKFCKDSIYNTSLESTEFKAPVDLQSAIDSTINFEFVLDNDGEVFYSE